MTDLIKVQTSALAGAALNWAVAKVEGVEIAIAEPHYGTDWRVYRPASEGKYSPSTDWAVGGLLLIKHQVNLHSPQHSDDCWAAWVTIRGKDYCHGAYQGLVAVCRAIVAAKLGDTVNVPAELVQAVQP